ncbi:B3 domain-containing protein [Actinidia chinensis var. chinensis]|uniref:B3 domain-containing protein n=1 Tax=Actinidia chinensis var. chinensis TaxID=1590841 RepID=A0A2R6Q2E3_ACTCC|nr:B3 domain-containing protein [Actinidia chinensis var. chinensis]
MLICVLQLIPISFFKYLNVENPNQAVLRTHCGEWQVKINNGQLSQDGWTDFAKRHGLQKGDFLVFRHEGDMVFDVMVFDPSACEREYPPRNLERNPVGSREEKESSQSKSMNDVCQDQMDKNSVKGEASNSTFSHPYFVSTLKPYSFTGYRINIPMGFARRHGLCNRCCEMIIKDDEGRSWKVRLRHKSSDGKVYIGHGWRRFQLANALKVGDVFSFELIDHGTKPIMVFHRSSKTKMVHPEEKKMPGKFTPKDFMATLTPFNFKWSELYIPKDFARLNGLGKYKKMTLKDPEKREWVLYLRKTSNQRLYIGQGWKELAAANDLQVGHVIKLELIKAGNTLAMKLSFQEPAAEKK